MDGTVIPTTGVSARSSCSSSNRQLESCGRRTKNCKHAEQVMKFFFSVQKGRMKDGVTVEKKEPRSNMIQS